MFIIITLLLTVLVSGIFGAVPAVVSRRRVSRRDAAWAAGLWLAVWVFALCALYGKILYWIFLHRQSLYRKTPHN